MKIKFNIGSDYDVIIPCLEQDEVTPFDLTDFTRVDVFLQYEGKYESIRTFSTSDSSAVISSPTTGEITIQLKRDDAALLAISINKDVNVTIKGWETDSDFTDNIAKLETIPVYFGTFIKAAGHGS